MKLLLTAALALLFVSCHPAEKSTSASEKASPEVETSGAASITADPNPATGSGELAETTIIWNTGTSEAGEVYVRKNKGEDKRFGAGTSGREKAPWIARKAHYEFLLYQGSEHKTVLARMQVTAAKKPSP